jgi:hypothetical protein
MMPGGGGEGKVVTRGLNHFDRIWYLTYGLVTDNQVQVLYHFILLILSAI